jgi:hypothetical protein
MNYRRIIWAAGLLLTFFLFYSWIPVGAYSQAPIFLSVLGAVLFLFFSVQLIGDFHNWEELITKDKSLRNWRHKVTPFMIFPAIGILIVFLIKLSAKETEELRKYGVTTKGYIRDGSGFATRRGGMFDLTIEFKDEEGNLQTIKKDVGEREFKRYSKGEQVTVIYSKKHPNILEIRP